MPYSIGKSFQPGADTQNGDAPGSRQSPVQSAIRLLSLRLPSVVGAQGIAPQALLQSPGGSALGGGGMGVDAVIAMLRRLMQQSGGDGGPQAQGVFGGGPQTTSEWLLDETNLGPRQPRQGPSMTPPPRVIPSQSPGEGPSAPAPQPRPAPYALPQPEPQEAMPAQEYGGFPIDQSDFWRG